MKKRAPLLLRQAIRLFIDASAKGQRKMPGGKPASKGTLVNYHYTLQLLTQYEAATSTNVLIPMEEGRANTSGTEKNHRYWKSFFRRFTKYLVEQQHYSDCYVSHNIKTLKTVFRFLQLEKGLPVGDGYRQFSVPKSQALPVVLMPEQLHRLIFDKEFEASLSPALRRAKDLVVFGCSTGLRVSDLQALKKTAICHAGELTYLQCYTQKTGTAVQIPVPAYCLEIIRRYQRRCGKYLLPRLCTSNLNVAMKKLGLKAGWTWLLPKYRSFKGKLQEIKMPNGESWKFYQHLSSHTMRRTAITTLLMMGVDEQVVRRISGHAPGSREFYRYVAIAQTYMDHQVQEAFERLGNNPTCYRQH